MGEAGVKRAVLALILLLGACAEPPTAPAPAVRAQQPAPPPAYSPPLPPYYQPRPQATPAPSASHDRCGADQLQWLVGRPRTEIPVPLEPGRRRVLCTTCPITRDINVFRQTILFDAASGRVTSVSCG